MRKRLLASALLLVAIHFPVSAQNDQLGNLNVVWGVDLSSGRLITIANDKREVINKFDWTKKKSPFFVSLTLPAHEYTIHLPGIVNSIKLSTIGDTATFLQVDQYKNNNGDVGIQITTWAGAPNKAVQEAIKSLTQSGDTTALEPIKPELVGSSFYFNTEPPWDIPPRPPKPPKP